jgi:type IV secretory pathway TrbL component
MSTLNVKTAACALVLAAWNLSAAAAPAPPTPAHGSAHASAATRAAAAKRNVVSPYARAAARHEHAGDRPVGNAPTLMQSMGKPRRPHGGAGSK